VVVLESHWQVFPSTNGLTANKGFGEGNKYQPGRITEVQHDLSFHGLRTGKGKLCEAFKSPRTKNRSSIVEGVKCGREAAKFLQATRPSTELVEGRRGKNACPRTAKRRASDKNETTKAASKKVKNKEHTKKHEGYLPALSLEIELSRQKGEAVVGKKKEII